MATANQHCKKLRQARKALRKARQAAARAAREVRRLDSRVYMLELRARSDYRQVFTLTEEHREVMRAKEVLVPLNERLRRLDNRLMTQYGLLT